MSLECSEQARQLLTRLEAVPARERWCLPFPLGVFGTLRAGLDNHRLMQRGRIRAACRAFLPHFHARDLQLYFQRGASAPFEVYFYDGADWEKVIGAVDDLEDFDPLQRTAQGYRRTLAWLRMLLRTAQGYRRTLAWLRMLPANFDHPVYAALEVSGERTLGIQPARWLDYEPVPCWIYSSLEQNRLASALDDSPVIWDGSQKVNVHTARGRDG